MHPSRFLILLPVVLGLLSSALAQNARPKGKANETYAQLCAACHGKNLEGAQAPSKLDDVWLAGSDDESIAKSIRNGFPEKGMPAWGAAIPEKEIRAMVIYIREQRALFQRGQMTFTKPADSTTAKSRLYNYKVNTWVDDLIEPWSLAFLSADQAIVTEKRGYLYQVDKGKISPRPLLGVPVVDTGGQAGLLDVVPHTDYAKNGWIYLALSDPQKSVAGDPVSLTRIVRGKVKEGVWVDSETIFRAKIEHYVKAGGVHFGGRIAFDRQGYLYFSVGDRGNGANAQDLTVPMGKVHRIFDDGRVPTDNPFAKDPQALPTIWSYGHRNPQGLARDPVTGNILDAEHGPRGGDELNWVQTGKNYGWPVITFGMNYDGSTWSEATAKEGMEQPMTYWVPSIAPCGINFYTGEQFPQWKNHLFLASLAAEELRRIEVKGDKVIDQEIIFKGLGRIRHVIGGPDGALYVLLPKRIARITPSE